MGKIRGFFTFERILIICAGVFLYANTLYNDYSLDDSYVTKKGSTASAGLKAIPEIITSGYGTDDTGKAYDYRPVVKISYAIEHQFFGVHSGMSHFFNIVFYLICLLLAYHFLVLFMEDSKSKIPLYIILLFAFLPIHTEVVASLKNRDILLSFIFSLLAAIILLKAHLHKKNLFLNYFLAAVFLYLALLSKLDATPFAAILPAFVFIKFKNGFKILVFSFIIFILVFALSRQTTKFFLHGLADRGYCYFENPLYFNRSFAIRTIALLNCLGFYVVQCVFPFKQSCYYGVHSIEVTSLTIYGYAGIIIAAATLYGIIHSYRKEKKGLLAGLFMFVASVSMFLNFFRPAVGIVADRFVFFSSFGFCITIIFLLESYLSGTKKIIPPLKLVALVLGIAYSYMTISRNTDWKDPNILIAADLKKYPESSYLNYLYATGVMDSLVRNKDNMPEKIREEKILNIKKHLEKSISISGDYPKSLNFLSSVLVLINKDYKEALPVINQSLAIQKNSEMYYYKGICFRELKTGDSAEYYLKKAINANKVLYQAYKMLMDDYNAAGKYDKSIELFTNAMKNGQENEFIFTSLANTYLEMKDTLSAEFYCQKAISIKPDSKEAQKIMDRLR
ncbi:MAG TPA: hypothetical protein VNZ49_07340 [Bacteroidia bacterium]|jgi:tetratricopeptide (TPR) repeat protein|nr:hypothetical protein [Bacteroidia bacterium]